MRKMLISLIVIVMMALASVPAYAGSQSDKQIAQQIANENGATVEKIVTKAKGGYKGNVIENGKVTKWTVKYPKKVKKGKKVTVYLVEKNDDYIAMVCLGKVK